MHPKRRETIDEDFECLLYLRDRFKTEAPEMPVDVVGQLIGGILNRTEKPNGLPAPAKPAPLQDFKRADEPVITNSMTGEVLNKPEMPIVGRALSNTPIDPFDKVKHEWICCPICNSTDIVQEGTKGRYHACFAPGCKVFLNVSKEGQPIIKEMKK